jgi:hypothetical protein
VFGDGIEPYEVINTLNNDNYIYINHLSAIESFPQASKRTANRDVCLGTLHIELIIEVDKEREDEHPNTLPVKGLINFIENFNNIQGQYQCNGKIIPENFKNLSFIASLSRTKPSIVKVGHRSIILLIKN